VAARLCPRLPAPLLTSSRALQVARESLIALGTCIGKFTHTNKFMLTIGALDLLTQHAKYKVRQPRGDPSRPRWPRALTPAHATDAPHIPAAFQQVWLKPSAEMSFLYGNHVLKSGLGRITDNTPVNAGVVVCSMSDVPLGFGTAAKSTLDCRKLDPTAIVAFHQADTGEYLRNEAAIVGGKGD
jgi:60S ribosome subunit biogenesis protein NIP7